MDHKINFSNILDLDDEYKEKLGIWRNQDFVREKMFTQQKIAKENHNEFIRHLADNHTKKVFVAFYNEDPFGVINYDYFDQTNRLEFGYYLINEKDLNGGLGVVLEFILLNHAFFELKVDEVFCRTMSFNKKVIHLHAKFGFITKDIIKDEIKIDGKVMEVYCQAISPNIWEGSREKIERLIKYMIPLENIGNLPREEH